MGASLVNLTTMVRDIIAEPTAARFSQAQITAALQAGLYDVAWRLPDDSAMNLRRQKTQVTAQATAFYALATDFMLEKGIMYCTLDDVPCTILNDIRMLAGYKQNTILTPSLLNGPIAWLQEQTVTSVLTWCINVDPHPESTGQLIYIYRAIPAVIVTGPPDVDSQLPPSCDEPVSLYAAMKLKGGRDDSDITTLKRLYLGSLTRIGANVEGV